MRLLTRVDPSCGASDINRVAKTLWYDYKTDKDINREERLVRCVQIMVESRATGLDHKQAPLVHAVSRRSLGCGRQRLVRLGAVLAGACRAYARGNPPTRKGQGKRASQKKK